MRHSRAAWTGLLVFLLASCGAEADDSAHVRESPAASPRAGVAEAAGDPVEAITAEFAKSGAQLEDGAIVESTIEDPDFAGVHWVNGEVDAVLGDA